MKILAIGDPHGSLDKIKKIPIKNVDAILLTGDLGKSELLRKYYFEYFIKKGIRDYKSALPKKTLENMYLEVINSSYNILKYLSSKCPTYFIFGNLKEIRTLNINQAKQKYKLSLPIFEDKIKGLKNITNLNWSFSHFQNEIIAGIPFFESNEWIKEFSPGNSKLLKESKKDELSLKKFVEKTKSLTILLTHIPPYGYLDKVQSKYVPKDWIGKHAGNRVILNYIEKYQPKLVLCGHIHEAKGEGKIGKTKIYNLGSNGDYAIFDVREKVKLIKSNFLKK